MGGYNSLTLGIIELFIMLSEKHCLFTLKKVFDKDCDYQVQSLIQNNCFYNNKAKNVYP